MDSKSYTAWRDNFIASQLPYRIVEPQELISSGENTYLMHGLELEVEPNISEQIDAFIGVSPRQSKSVTDTFGANGIRDLRNYLALSNSVEKAGKLALIADPKERKIVGATHLKQEAIPAESFFDFLEMFMNDNGYMPDTFYTSGSLQGGVTVSLMPNTPNYNAIAEDEEFMTNGVWFRWNLGEVEAGNYYMRMICSNGHMVRTERKIAHSYQLNDTNVAKMLALPRTEFIMAGFDKLRTNALLAMRTEASMGEVRMVDRLLSRYGVEQDIANEIAPYEHLLGLYQAAGYATQHFPINQARSGINMWDLINRITAFASHTPIWEVEDNRRSGLMMESVRLLNCPRDIKEYISIF
ncbi:MAG: hypothetical protein J6C80_02110 [Flavobacteriales bacterium]|nr:hypothetical protein [Flavobacteriales bacterium]